MALLWKALLVGVVVRFVVARLTVRIPVGAY